MHARVAAYSGVVLLYTVLLVHTRDLQGRFKPRKHHHYATTQHIAAVRSRTVILMEQWDDATIGGNALS